MKILYPDRITGITADEENANYLIANARNDCPKEKWKATSEDARVILVVSQGAGCAIFEANATGIVAVVNDIGLTCSWLAGNAWITGTAWLGETSVTATYGIANGKGALWIDYAEISEEHTIHLYFTAAAGTIIAAGIIQAGDVSSFRDPSQGVGEGLKDYSIIRKLNTGAPYIKKRAIARTFQFQVTEDRDTDFYTFMLDIMRERGGAALPWRLVTDSLTGWEWIVFADMEAMPQGDHFEPAHARLGVTLTEAT